MASRAYTPGELMRKIRALQGKGFSYVDAVRITQSQTGYSIRTMKPFQTPEERAQKFEEWQRSKAAKEAGEAPAAQ